MTRDRSASPWFVAGMALASALIAAGWLTAFTSMGAVLLLFGLGTGIIVAVSTRNLQLTAFTVAGLLAFVIAFPLLVNVAVWIAGGFSGPDGGREMLPK